MNFKDFLNFNKKCPICGHFLSFYMQATNFSLSSTKSILFKFNDLLLNSEYDFAFIPSFKGISHITKNIVYLDPEEMTLYTDTKISDVYFFFICNPKGISNIGNSYDYEIELYRSCYYRSTKYYNLSGNQLMAAFGEFGNYNSVLRDEAFVFKYLSFPKEKVYLYSLNYENNNSILWHYGFDQISGDKSEVSETKLSFPSERPDFSLAARHKLINKFNSWITFS